MSFVSRRVFVVLLVTLLLTGCDLLGSDDPPRITGTYEGQIRMEGFTWTIRFALAETKNDVVTGSGWRSPVQFDAAVPFTISGIYEPPNVTLTLESSDQPNVEIVGTISTDGSTLTGIMRDPNRTRELSLVRRRN